MEERWELPSYSKETVKCVEEVRGGGGQAAGVEGAWNVLSCTHM